MAVKKNSDTIPTLPFKEISVLFSVAVAIVKNISLVSVGKIDGENSASFFQLQGAVC